MADPRFFSWFVGVFHGTAAGEDIGGKIEGVVIVHDHDIAGEAVGNFAGEGEPLFSGGIPVVEFAVDPDLRRRRDGVHDPIHNIQSSERQNEGGSCEKCRQIF